MAPSRTADSIKILVSTDNHVGYNERDAVRGDDSWRSFDEVMTIAKERDVDLVLLAGDLFHENKPSRKSMYQVMRSLRENCYGDKPCELQMLSDGSEHFAGYFNHVNYQDQDINVAIPVFSIHGNHDDPSGEGNFAALDLLAMSGLLNYYGRTPESDNIDIKPVLLQKGSTKLALYGMSNVRDERLFRTFRDGNVTFFSPTDQNSWFNIMSVHQNHHAYTETSYLPEQYLPAFMDLIIWGHEHECKIDPQRNPEMGFKVMQPGSSVATSLVKGEAVPKHIALLTVTGTDYEMEKIRLKSVRPFVMKEIVMKDYPEMREAAEQSDNGAKVIRFLTDRVEELIDQANEEWEAAQLEDGGEIDEEEERPLPLIRLRVEVTEPEGGKWELENPQRFSKRFAEKIANTNDIVQFHRKRGGPKISKNQPDEPEEQVMASFTIDNMQVDKLVKEFLGAQSMAILPQNRFSDSVGHFVDKDDKHAMDEFLKDSLKLQIENLMDVGREDGEEEDVEKSIDEERLQEAMEEFRIRQEEAHARGEGRRKTTGKRKPKPSGWDSDSFGPWVENYASMIWDYDPAENGTGGGDDDDDDDDASIASAPAARPARGRGSRGGRGGKAATGTTRKAAAPKKAPAKTSGRGKKKPVSEDDDDDSDVIMLDGEDEESQSLFVSQATSRSRMQRAESPAKKAAPKTTKSTRGRGSTTTASRSAAATARQTQLSFGSTQPTGTQRNGTGRAAAAKATQSLQVSDDEISDDDDAFEPPTAAQRSSRR